MAQALLPPPQQQQQQHEQPRSLTELLEQLLADVADTNNNNNNSANDDDENEIDSVLSTTVEERQRRHLIVVESLLRKELFPLRTRIKINALIDEYHTTLKEDVHDMMTDQRLEQYAGLDSNRDTIEEVTAILQLVPDLLQQRKTTTWVDNVHDTDDDDEEDEVVGEWVDNEGDDEGEYPIQCLVYERDNEGNMYFNSKAVPFIHLFAQLALEYNTLDDEQRGGLVIENGLGVANLFNGLVQPILTSCLSDDDCRRADEVRTNELIRLQQFDLLTEVDVRDYELLGHLCKHKKIPRRSLAFLIEWSPDILLLPIGYIAFGGAGAAAAAGTFPPIVARPMQRNMAAAAGAPMLNPMMMGYPQPPIYTGPVLVARGISAKKDLEKARKKQQRSTTKATTTSAGPSKKQKRRSSISSVGTTSTKKSALASLLGASSSVYTDPVTGKQKRQYGMHQNPEYIQIHLKGLYKWCCTENNYKVDATQYCKAVHGELHHRYRAFLQKHFKSAKLEKHLEQRIHFANRSITDKIEKHTEAYRQEELEKKRKKKEEADAAKVALEAAKAAAAERGEPMEMDTIEAIAGGVAAADGMVDEGMDTESNTNDATNRDPTNVKTTDTPSAPPRTDPLKIGEHVIARSVLDYARLEVYNAEQDAIKKAKELKRNQEFGEKSKYSMKQRIYFNHKDPRYIREHLYGIYKHGYQNNQTVNVNQYCHNHFDYVRGRTKSATKYKSLMVRTKHCCRLVFFLM